MCRFCGTNLLYGKPVNAPHNAPPPVAPQRPYAPPPPQPQPQPAPMPPPMAPMAPRPYYAPPMQQQGGYLCPQCGTPHPPQLIRKMSQSGLIVLIVMALFCFPLFWIGLLMKEDSYVCPQCGRKAN